MSTSKSSSNPTGPSGKKPPRTPRYVSQRKSDGGLFYVRRLPQALIDAGFISAKTPTVRIALGTKDWLTAQAKARQLSAAHDQEWSRLLEALARGPQGSAPVNPRRLQADDVPVLARRLEALLLHTDDVDRSLPLSAEQFDAYEDELTTQRKALRNANQRSDLAAVAEEAVGFLEAEGLECDESSPHWMAWLRAALQAHLAALSRIASRLDGDCVVTPYAPPPVRSEDDLDDLDRALQYWQTKAQPQPKTVIEVAFHIHLPSSVTANRTGSGNCVVRARWIWIAKVRRHMHNYRLASRVPPKVGSSGWSALQACDDCAMKIRGRRRRWRCWLRRRKQRQHAAFSFGAWAAAKVQRVTFPPSPVPGEW